MRPDPALQDPYATGVRKALRRALAMEAIGGAGRGALVAVASVLSTAIAPAAFAAVTAPQTVHDSAPAHRPLPGVLTQRRLESDRRQLYYVYVPRLVLPGAPVVVAVHGISRNAEEHARRLAPYAERYGAVLVAPLFDEAMFPDYQRLGRASRGGRADRMLIRIVGEVARTTPADGSALYLFGFSGGGQFVHRFAMAYPERVASYVIGAAGWYTFPDASLRFPRGTQAERCFEDLCFEPERYLRVPALVLVGERDVHEGSALRRGTRIDEQQGQSRLERGEHWVAAMRAEACAHGFDTPFEFAVLPRSGHSFTRAAVRGRIGERIFEWFFGGRAGNSVARPQAVVPALPLPAT